MTSCNRNQEIKVQIWKKKKKAFSLEQGVMSLCLRPNPLRKLFFEKKKKLRKLTLSEQVDVQIRMH